MNDECLNPDLILSALEPEMRQRIRVPECFQTIDSTNSYLMDRAASEDFHGQVCLAEEQTAGRGRRGREWVSPQTGNIYLSMGWQMRPPETGIGGLSIAIGMHVARALKDMGVERVGLKWPNDLLLAGNKVAGILVEVASARQDRVRLVAGIGINLFLEERDVERIGYQPATLGATLSRNALAGSVIAAIAGACEQFERHGLSPLVCDWEKHDEYIGRAVTISVAESKVSGINRGIDSEGNLLLETEDGTRRFNAGEVSLRPA